MNNKSLYTELCAAHPGMLVFAQAWWLDKVCHEWDVAITRKGERITGAWTYPIDRKAGISIMRSPKMTPYLGPQVFFPADMKESNRDSFEYDTIAELLKLLPDAPVWDLAVQPGIKQAGLLQHYGLTPQVRQTFIVDLGVDEATLLANMKETTRRNIKQAEKECVITNEPACINELFEFHKHTLGRKEKGIAHSLADLQQLLQACIANNAGALWVARQNGVIQGACWMVWDQNFCYSIMNGQNPQSESSKAMSLLHWHSMKEAQKMGLRQFDFEGSMDPGVERFFRSFGGTRELYLVLLRNNSLLWKLKQAIR